VFAGRFTISHGNGNSYSGDFNGTFFPSGQIFEVHATWRITEGSRAFSQISGAGTAKGVANVVNNAFGPTPGPGSIVLDGSIILDNANEQ